MGGEWDSVIQRGVYDKVLRDVPSPFFVLRSKCRPSAGHVTSRNHRLNYSFASTYVVLFHATREDNNAEAGSRLNDHTKSAFSM